ncbi:MAG: glycosyltransferase [Lachnospiraceae bacterium]|nr:glycosyltransferase [Lachnospiraceae bacterium]
MRILIVNKFLYPNGGSETYIFKLGEELKRRGHLVSYFGMEHEGRVVGNGRGLYTSNMDFHSGGLKKLIYPFKIIYSREAYKKMYKLMDRFLPDVVHLNNFNFQLTPSIIYAARKWEKRNKKRVKIVYTAHDSQWVCPNHLMLVPSTGERCFDCEGGCFNNCIKKKCIHNSFIKSFLASFEAKYYLARKTYRMVDAIISPSEFIKNKIETYPLFASRNGDGRKPLITTMHNFLDKKEDGKKDTDGKSDKGNYVLYFGRYSEEKGVETLLKVCEQTPEINYKFAGSGPLKHFVESKDNITEMGFLQGEELVKVIKRAQITIFPSECYENCPFTVMESIAYGTPVLASNLGGVPELLDDGVTGELFKAGDANDLKAHLKSMLEDSEKLREYTEKCKKAIFDSVSDYTDKFLKIVK